MLQFIAQINDRYSISELVKMAIEGGCRWIQLHLPGLTDDDIKAMSADIIDLCRESAVFLMLEDRPDLAKELGLHGVHLRSLADASPAQIREQLGPEAVIGIHADSATAILDLRGVDIDYVAIPADMHMEQIAAIISEVRGEGFEIPIVAAGEISPDQVSDYLSSGVSGIATSLPSCAADPVSAVSDTILAIEKAVAQK